MRDINTDETEQSNRLQNLELNRRQFTASFAGAAGTGFVLDSTILDWLPDWFGDSDEDSEETTSTRSCTCDYTSTKKTEPFGKWRQVGVFDPGPSPAFNATAKNSENPVLKQGNGWDADRVADPEVIKVGDEWRIYYSGRPERSIGVATSPDGLVDWSKRAENPVLTPGASGSWDSSTAERPSVIKLGGKYYMWYTGSDGSTSQIGLATSDDGISWTKHDSNPVLTPNSSGWDSSHVYSQGVLYEGGTVYLFYTAKGSSSEQIGYATSADGVNWSKSSSNPVLPPSSSGWDSINTHNPDLTKVGSTYHMVYSGKGSTSPNAGHEQVGHAWSTDLDNWTKNPHNPIISHGADSEWDYDDVTQGEIVRDGDTFELFYAGDDASGAGTKIGNASIDITEPADAAGAGLPT